MKRITLIINCVLFACLFGWANPGSEGDTKPGYTIDDCIHVFSKVKIETSQSGWVYWFVRESFTETGMNLKMSYVDKQTETHPPHRHSTKEIFYIIEGQAEVFLADSVRVIGPNSSMYCPPDVLHGIKRADDKPLKYLVIKEGLISASSRSANDNLPESENCITRFSEEKINTTKTGWAFWFHPKSLTDGLNLKMSYVDKLTGTHEAHQHPNEEILYLLEGEAEIHINGEIKIIGPGTSIYYPGNSLHCIKRINDEPIKYLVINP